MLSASHFHVPHHGSSARVTFVTLVRAKPRRRRPSISKQIKDAEKSGRTVTSITLPDGTRLDFGKAESTEPENPWLAAADQARLARNALANAVIR